MSSLGNHILVEFTGCNPDVLNNVSSIENNMVLAAEKAGATVINSTFHHFSPIGVSGVVVIQESHLAIHTWPEYGYAAVDLFTCGDQVDAWRSFDFLQEVFESKNHSAIEMKRGSLNLLSRLDFDINSLRSQVEQKANPQRFTRNLWFTDKDEDQALSLRYKGDILYQKDSPFQKVTVLDTYKYGKMLALDNMVMTTEEDEFHYHEMIAHPAILTHGNVKNVLVIGGGDGGTIREVLKHPSIEKVTMVEIDELVIEACKEHLPNIACEFDHPKLNLIIGDGLKIVEESKEKYDLILCDNSDPVGPSEGLFSVAFYTNCHSLLNEDGILVVQGESPKFNEKVFCDINKTIGNIFGKSNAYISLFFVPTYPTGMWSFQWGIKGKKSPQEIDKKRCEEFSKKHQLKYYNEDIHQNTFALPGFVKNML
jgi:spermidine synthase